MAMVEKLKQVGDVRVALVEIKGNVGRYRVTLQTEEKPGDDGPACWVIMEFANHIDAQKAFGALVELVHLEAGLKQAAYPRDTKKDERNT